MFTTAHFFAGCVAHGALLFLALRIISTSYLGSSSLPLSVKLKSVFDLFVGEGRELLAELNQLVDQDRVDGGDSE